jgi:Mce-associated membrane protein
VAQHDDAPDHEPAESDSIEDDGAEGAGEADEAPIDTEVEGVESEGEVRASTTKKWFTPARIATLISVAIVVMVAALAGFLGLRTYQSEQAQNREAMFVAAARQGAINLTTIDWQNADADISRILDSATGTFYDDFSKRSQPFVEVVKQAQSKSVGTVTDAGLESESGDEAQVLVAVQVKTTSRDTQEQRPRAWRMRINVQKLGDQAKVSNVQFVP